MDFRTWLDQEKKDLKQRTCLYPKKKLLFSISGVLLLFWALFRLWSAVPSQKIAKWDNLVMEKIMILKTPFLDAFFSLVTILGTKYFITIVFLILAVVLIKKRRKRATAAILLSLAGSGFLVYFLKNFFNRLRPFDCPGGYDCLSFPSGHTTLSFYFYGVLFYLIFQFLEIKRIICWLIGIGLIFLVMEVGLSRIYFGLHYPSDVIGGFLLGGIWLLIVVTLIDFLYR